MKMSYLFPPFAAIAWHRAALILLIVCIHSLYIHSAIVLYVFEQVDSRSAQAHSLTYYDIGMPHDIRGVGLPLHGISTIDYIRLGMYKCLSDHQLQV